jgi:hypothetical protein
MFLRANLYNSACSNAVNPIRIHPIILSIILHHYKMLKETGLDSSSNDNNFYDYNTPTTILKQRNRQMV